MKLNIKKHLKLFLKTDLLNFIIKQKINGLVVGHLLASIKQQEKLKTQQNNTQIKKEIKWERDQQIVIELQLKRTV